MRSRDTSWIFSIGAECYAWFTDQAQWQASCTQLARSVPVDAERILDLGCGYGVSTQVIRRERPSGHVIGLDRASRMLGLARQRKRPGALAWTRGDAGALPFGSATFDAVTMHSVLYLLPDPALALEEVRRVLRPGGWLIVMEPSAAHVSMRTIRSLSTDLRFLISATLWRAMSSLHGRFSANALEWALTTAGFGEVTVEHTLGGLGLLGRARSLSSTEDQRNVGPAETERVAQRD